MTTLLIIYEHFSCQTRCSQHQGLSAEKPLRVADYPPLRDPNLGNLHHSIRISSGWKIGPQKGVRPYGWDP